MRHGATAVILGLSILAIAGCDEDVKKKADGPATAAVDSRPANSADLDMTGPALSTLNNATSASASAASEQLASNSSALFDGTKSAGDIVMGPTPVSAGSKETWRSAPKISPNSKTTKVSLDAGSRVPSPNTLPAVLLPSETDAQASAGAKGGGPTLLAYEAFEKTLYDTIYPLFSRKAWHAAPAKFESYHQVPSRVTVHHTDGKQYMDQAEALAYVKSVQAMHMNSNDPKHGWDDIGYHFLIDGAGRVYEGRHTSIMGAHAKNANENNIGISLMGDYNRDVPTKPEIDSLRRLVTFLALQYRTDPRQKGFIEPHKHYNNTDCPGNNVVAILPDLNTQVDNETAALVDKLKSQTGNIADASSFIPLVVTQPSHS
jgi:hypothetical protein